MRLPILTLLLLTSITSNSWGFYAHMRINYFAVFLLPPEMLVLYKPNIEYLEEHAVDPDKRRYAVAAEGPRHYIDVDHYGAYPYNSLPRKWKDAVAKFSADTLNAHGIVPYWLQTMLYRLTAAFQAKDKPRILKLSAEIGHYIADSHVPLHASSNHNGQFTNQKGIHGFWESRIPELFAEPATADNGWDFFIGKAELIRDPTDYIWKRVLESGAASDSVLKLEKELSQRWAADQRYAFENRNGVLTRQYSTPYTTAYNSILNGMVERRMRQSIYSVASFWFTAWVNAGQPDLSKLSGQVFTRADSLELNQLNDAWKNGRIKDREHAEH